MRKFALLLIAMFAITLAPANATSTNDPVVTWISNRPCAEEDSVNCSWNAGESGNGVGHSFIVRHMPGTNKVCYLYEQRKFARTHDHCFTR